VPDLRSPPWHGGCWTISLERYQDRRSSRPHNDGDFMTQSSGFSRRTLLQTAGLGAAARVAPNW